MAALSDYAIWIALETEAWRSPRDARGKYTAPSVQQKIVNTRNRVWNGMTAAQKAAAAGAVRNFRQDQVALANIRTNNPIPPALPFDLADRMAVAAYRDPLETLRAALINSTQLTTQLRNIRNTHPYSNVTATWLTSVENAHLAERDDVGTRVEALQDAIAAEPDRRAAAGEDPMPSGRASAAAGVFDGNTPPPPSNEWVSCRSVHKGRKHGANQFSR